MLIDAGANLNSQNNENCTALHMAINDDTADIPQPDLIGDLFYRLKVGL